MCMNMMSSFGYLEIFHSQGMSKTRWISINNDNEIAFYRILPHCNLNVDVLMETIHEAATRDEKSYSMMTAAFNPTGQSIICPLVFDARCIQAEKVCDNQAQKNTNEPQI